MKPYSIAILLFMFGCANITTVAPNGTIEGKVTIAPLCGSASLTNNVDNPCGLTNEEIDGIYKKYSVVLTSINASLNQKKVLNHTGLFSFDVPEGEYTLVIESELPDALRFSSAANTQKIIKIKSGEKQSFQLSVNTGLP